MKQQLGTITVILSSHGMVTSALFHPAKTEETPEPTAIASLLQKVRDNDAKTTGAIEHIIAGWYTGIKTVAGTITAEDCGTRRIMNSNRLRTVFRILVNPVLMHQAVLT